MTKKSSFDIYLELYKKMLLIRRFEEKAGQLYGMGKIGGKCRLRIAHDEQIGKPVTV